MGKISYVRFDCTLTKGHAEGRAEGAKDEAMRIAAAMKASNVPIETIAACTDLPTSTIQDI